MAQTEMAGLLEEVNVVCLDEGDEMQCPFLRGWLITCCTADETPFVLAPFIVQEYCKGKNFRKCPFNPAK